MPRAVVLLSGGLDSTTCLAVAVAQGFEVHALSFDYGQRHHAELAAATRVATAFRVAHAVVGLDLRSVSHSALTGQGAVPKGRDVAHAADIPATYVPARNTIFLSVALGLAESIGAFDLFIGVNALDYSGYPDCRPEFLRAFEDLANVATKAGVEGASFHLHAPLLRLSKAQIVTFGQRLGVPFELTHSCYDPAADGSPCGACDSCVLRAKGFAEAGVVDPIVAAAAAGPRANKRTPPAKSGRGRARRGAATGR